MVIEMEDAMFEELEDIVKGIFEIYQSGYCGSGWN